MPARRSGRPSCPGSGDCGAAKVAAPQSRIESCRLDGLREPLHDHGPAALAADPAVYRRAGLAVSLEAPVLQVDAGTAVTEIGEAHLDLAGMVEVRVVLP